jgi:hypothetical protein
MAEEKNGAANALVKASLWYANQTLVQALVEAVPMVGGSFNTLLAGAGIKRKEQRVLHFISELRHELEHVKEAPAGLDRDELTDFLIDTTERVSRSRSADKRVRFARLVSGQILQPRDWDEAEMSARLLDDLTDLHIKILAAAVNASMCDAPFDGLRVVALSDWPQDSKAERKPLLLPQLLTVAQDTVRMACAELLSRGLLHDEGIGRWDGKAMEVFVATPLAVNFLQWIGEAELS